MMGGRTERKRWRHGGGNDKDMSEEKKRGRKEDLTSKMMLERRT